MGRPAALAPVLVAGLVAAAPSAAAAAPLALDAQLRACATGPQGADRRAAFKASMPARSGASVLAVRFTLQRRTRAGWRRVAAPTFDRWERSAPGAAGLVFTKRVDGLWSPGRFRAVVRFAWHDALGRVVARARRRTAACRQPDRRPDLRPQAVAVAPAADGTAAYTVRLVNEGRGALEQPADVLLRAGGRVVGRASVLRLPAGRTVAVGLRGPACAPGETLRVTADPAHDVRERDERDNVLEVACPA